MRKLEYVLVEGHSHDFEKNLQGYTDQGYFPIGNLTAISLQDPNYPTLSNPWYSILVSK